MDVEKEEPLFQVSTGHNANLYAEKQRTDPKLKSIIDRLRKSNGVTDPQNVIGRNYALIHGVLYKINKSITGNPWKLIVPPALRKQVMAWMHENGSAGHGAFLRTYTLIRRKYYWENMIKAICNH